MRTLSCRATAAAGILIAIATTGCAIQPVERDLGAFEAAAPRSILVVPVVNHSLDVEAPGLLLSTLPVPLAEKGYYVFPVHTVQTVLEQEGWYEAEKVREQPTAALAKLFGADAVLYVAIHRWDAQYAILAAAVTVEVSYRLVARDGTEIWTARRQVRNAPDPNAGGANKQSGLAQLLAAALTAAATRAAPDYLPLAKQANREAFTGRNTSIPDGPYRPKAADGGTASAQPRAASAGRAQP